MNEGHASNTGSVRNGGFDLPHQLRSLGQLGQRFLGTASSTIGNLDHLIGQVVQVVSGGDYLGQYQVNSSGQVLLEDDLGQPFEVSSAVVGLPMSCRMDTLPFITGAPDSQKRTVSVFVRVLRSAIPMINGERPPEREVSTPMNRSEAITPLVDLQVGNFGHSSGKNISIEESVPRRVEIAGIFGTLEANKP